MSSASSVSDYIEGLTGFAKPAMEKLCRIIRRSAPHLEEGLRWGTPSWKGRAIVCAIACFKAHVSLTLWRGAEVPDPRKRLIHGQGKSSMRTAKFASAAEVNDKEVSAWITAAVALDHAGPAPRPKREPKPEAVVPAPLSAAFRRNKAAREAFAAMSPSCRREYCTWIAGAKQETTVARRVAKALEKLEAREGLMDKYKK